MIMNAIEMFGCEKSVLEAAYADMIGFKELTIMGMMSDAQHEMAHGMDETARQTLNRAKYFLSRVLEERIDAGQF
jgi:hypothetical protein